METNVKEKERPTYVCPYETCKRVFRRHYLYRQHLGIALAHPDEAHKLVPLNAVLASKKPPKTAREHSQTYRTTHPEKVKAGRDEYNARRLEVILRLSNSLPETLATRDQTLEIVRLLRTRRFEGVQRRKDYQTVEIPADTTVRLLIDVLRLCNLDEQPPQSHDITSGAKSEQPLERAIAALFALERDPSTDTTATPAHATSIWSIPPTADGLQQWTSMIRGQMIRANRGLGIDTVYSTTVSPAGMFSTWHIDQTWGGTLLIGLDHPKLFVTCPPTEKNLEVYDKIDEFGHIDESIKALSKFEQLSYIVLIKGDVYILPPGYIHMVLSMRNSAVGGWVCFKAEWADMARDLSQRDIARFIECQKALLNDETALRFRATKGDLTKSHLRAANIELNAAKAKLQADLSELEANWAKAETIYADLRRNQHQGVDFMNSS